MVKRYKIKTILVLTAIVSIAVFLTYGYFAGKSSDLPKKVRIDTSEIKVDLATNFLEQARGLGGRDKLEEDQGMLFMFSRDDYYNFWMKDMKFPIDIIWIKNDTIIDMSQNVPIQPGVSDFKLISYSPHEKADRVLEVNAGFVSRNKIKVGDRVEYIYE